MQMQAAIITEFNTPFRIETVELAPPKAGEVLVKLAASGVCHSDWHVLTGTTPRPLPIITGHEGAGVVETIGDAVTRVQPGDRVTLSWRPECGECHYCLKNKPNLCETLIPVINSGLQIDGTSRVTWRSEPVYIMNALGCFAEYVVVQERCCVPIDGDVPLEVAALVGCAVSTGVGAAMYTADVRAGQSVVVYGVGGVGLNIVQGARLCGADPIIAVDTSGAKLEFAREFGATHTLLSDKTTVAQIQKLTEGRGADHVFESVGLPALQARALDAVCPGGMLTLVGVAPADSLTSWPGLIIMAREKTIRGSLYGSVNPHRDFPLILDLYASGKLKLDELVTRRYRLDEINQAYDDMLSGGLARGVIVF